MRAPLAAARAGLLPGLVLSAACGLASLSGCTALREGEAYDPEAPPGDGTTPGGPVLRESPSGCRGVPCAADNPCAAGRRCVDGVCFPDEGKCSDDSACAGDLRCFQGACVPWDACKKLTPYDPECKGQVFTPEEFKPPVVACSLTGYRSLSIPVVADLDGDKKPEVITIAYPNTILAMRGDSCALMWKNDREPLLSGGQGSVAVADLDADGAPEVVAVDSAGRVFVLDKNGNLLARSPTPTQEQNPYGQGNWSAPAIADLDGTAPPEIIAGAQVVRYVKTPSPHIDVLWTKPNRTAFWGSLPIAADLDGDGKQEVISSDKIYDGITGADKTPPALSQKPFYAQVGDFNGDKKPDLVLVQSERGSQIVSVYDYANKATIFGPYRVAEGGWGGPAVVADFDGDKVPDFGLASASSYYTYAMKCARTPKPADCKGTDPGVLWSKRTQDASSGGTGSSVFDFNGDGTAEVVYRDECFLRVYNGRDGKTLFAHNITSNTCLELPVIADVNNDGHADIVVTSDDLGACSARSSDPDTGAPWTGLTTGLFVLRDPMNRWMPSRPLWNQHAYHITNINDDLTVTSPEPDNWLSYNNYRQNVQGGPMGSGNLPDPTSRQGPALDTTDCSKLWRLHGEVCNRGAGPTAVPLSSTFYDGHPEMGGKAVCTATLSKPVAPGTCAALSCDWNSPPAGARDIYLRVGDDGRGGRAGGQCKTSNDLSVRRGISCANVPG
ncbi:MAG: FG-GAP-like repeat-containing protein [Polyangia bacterium]